MSSCWVIHAGQLLPGPADHRRINDGAVLIDGDNLAAVGTRREIEDAAPTDASWVARPSSTVLPGLVNAHVHLAFDGTRELLDREMPDEELALAMAGRAQRLLQAGVTTARDLGDRGGLAARVRDAINGGVLAGPRLLAATVPLTTPGGHCWFLGGEVASDQEIGDRVAQNAAAGADLIKVMASRGQMTQGAANMHASQFTYDQLATVVDAAHRHGLPVAAHAHGADSIEHSVAAGVDTVEHCTWLTDGLDMDKREHVAKAMARGGVYASGVGGNTWRSLRQAAGEEFAERLYRRLTWMDSLGVPLAVGTDAGLPGNPVGPHVEALRLYEHLGFSPSRIIELATTSSAAALGLASTTGQLAVGYSADVLVVDGDPLSDLDALYNVGLVLSRGRSHPLIYGD